MKSGLSVSLGPAAASTPPPPNLLKFFTSTLPSNSIWSWVAGGGGVFVAIQNGGNAAYSIDNGQTWVTAAMPYNVLWQSVCYNNGRFVAVCFGAPNFTAYSDDLGKTWHSGGNLPSAAQWYAVTAGAGALVAVATGPSAAAAYSVDNGLTWIPSTLPDSSYWSGVAFDDVSGNFVAVQNGPTSAVSQDNGRTWGTAAMPAFTDWFAIAASGGVLVAIANGAAHAAYSKNGGLTWTASTLPFSNNWTSVAAGNGAFLAVSGTDSGGDSLGAAISSDGGATWQPVIVPGGEPPNGQNWLSVAFENGAFVAVPYQSATAMVTKEISILNADAGNVNHPSPVSGTAFQPSLISKSFVSFQVDAAAAGSYTLSIGPVTGAENSILDAANVLAGSKVQAAVIVPAGWFVVITLTTVTLDFTAVVEFS